MGKKMTIEEAMTLGREDGAEAVDCLLYEVGMEGLRGAVAPGQTSWDEVAINAGAFESACSTGGMAGSKTIRDAYYREYEKAACERASDLLTEVQA